MPEKIGGAVLRMAPATISRVSFGVRYEPQFKVQDRGGEIVDAIVRTPGSPFGPETFPQLQTTPVGRTLINPEHEHVLKIDQQDAILIWHTETRDVEEVQRLARSFEDHVLVHLRKLAAVRQIVRYGMVLRLIHPAGTLQNPPIARYLADEFNTTTITSLAMRFTRRLPADEAVAKKGVEDYRQVIYSVDESENGVVQITFDYQDYFRPLLDAGDWERKPFTQFTERGSNYFDTEFRNWLKAFVQLPEVA